MTVSYDTTLSGISKECVGRASKHDERLLADDLACR